MLQCHSLIEELSASHSTDLQQRAYELQAVIGLDVHAVEIIMPSDASCEDIEIDKNLSFLSGYVQQALEKGAQCYIPENERSGMSTISNFRTQEHQESSMHVLRFEAYELPKPTGNPKVASLPSVSSSDPLELRLRLDGVQKKWGRPTYSSSEKSTSNSVPEKSVNGVTKVVDAAGTVSTRARDTSYDSRKAEVEISPEKQKLAASLFGGSSKTERRMSTTGHKAGKAGSHVAEKPQVSKGSDRSAAEKTVAQPQPDLLDLGNPTVPSSAQSYDPFKQLEGLLDSNQVTSSVNHNAAGTDKAPDIMGLYLETAGSGSGNGSGVDVNLLSGLSNPTIKNAHEGTATTQSTQFSKGPNTKDALEKDALVRQMGVTPTSQNPNLFKDLLG
ncbi:hypothetical protein Patl1_22015 [Pistacia atlantica]|uniref:Uncharacterized protein n=1 Tax=Pistacia atlantica TaxID=434234 RepID=A0ACC1BHA4_9ROSI|nr:hypothetical protein Patl1_22015 [Pistacia atlantica]